MRVVHVVDTLNVGGAERSLLAIASRFRRYEPLFITCYPGEALADEAVRMGVRRVALNVSDRYGFREVVAGLQQQLAALQPELVQATLFRAEIATRIALHPRQVPLVGSFVNDSYSQSRFEMLNPRATLKLRAAQALDAATSGLVSGWVSISKTVALSNSDALKVPANKIEIIYRGRELDRFPLMAPAQREACRASYGWAPEDLVVLNVARLLDRKGQEELIHAVPLLLPHHPTLRLVIAGEGEHRAHLEALVASLGVGRSVDFLGSRSDIPQLLASCDVFAFPSHYEGLGGALVEAMLAGTSILASDTDVHQESVSDHKTARLFRVKSPVDLARVAGELLGDPDQRRVLGTAARAAAVERFDVRTIAAAHEDLYDRVIDAHKSRRRFVARPWPQVS